MILDAAVLRFMQADDWRVLTAIEMGMKNHELVPTTLIASIAGLEKGPNAAIKVINGLHRNKLIYHERKVYDGYRLTYLGYDFLALHTYVARGLITALGRRIGVGKEADIYECANEKGESMVIKLHRLGRISFRQIKNKRDYLLHRKNASWMYMSRLAAIREFTYLKSLYDHGFPVPIPYSNNRHTILMSKVDAFPFGQVDKFWPEGTEEKKQKKILGEMFEELMQLIVRLGQHGLVHADFNEFNLLIDSERKITLIDFPQMVSTRHPEAGNFFERDVGCVASYFGKKFKYDADELPELHVDIDESQRIDLDKELAASGHAHVATAAQKAEFERVVAGRKDERGGGGTTNGLEPIARKNYEDNQDEEDEDGEDDNEDDEDGDDEEALVAQLGLDASDLMSEQKETDADETERLRKEVDGVTRADTGRAAASSSSSKKATAAAATEEETKANDDDNEEEEEEEEEDEAEVARKRAALKAEKAERKAAADAKAAGKAARKVQEKERQKREREAGPQPMPEAGEEAAAAAAAESADSSSAAAAAAAADSDEEDRQSIASSAASQLQQLRMNSKNLLNIQLAKPQVRAKKANLNKDREWKKVNASIKEHLQM